MKPIFSQQELDIVKPNVLDVVFSDQQIYIDDTILTIKLKILLELETRPAMEEMFMFCMKKDNISPTDFYNGITQRRRVAITRERLENALVNFKQNTIFETYDQPLPETDKFMYDDLVGLNVFNSDINTTSMLGQKFFIITSQYPFPYNPFDDETL